MNTENSCNFYYGYIFGLFWQSLIAASTECCQGYTTTLSSEGCADVSSLIGNTTEQTFTFFNNSGLPIRGYPGSLGEAACAFGKHGECPDDGSEEPCDPLTTIHDFTSKKIKLPNKMSPTWKRIVGVIFVFILRHKYKLIL